MVTELRDYRIAEGHLEEFVEAWLRGVLPLRRAKGFSIDGAWVAAEDTRFVWLLSREGSWEEFTAADAAYYASADRAAVNPDPAQWIASANHTALRDVLNHGPAARNASRGQR